MVVGLLARRFDVAKNSESVVSERSDSGILKKRIVGRLVERVALLQVGGRGEVVASDEEIMWEQ